MAKTPEQVRERDNAYARARRIAKAELISAQRHAKRLVDEGRINTVQKAWRDCHLETVNAQVRARYDADPGKRMAHNAKHRAAKRNAPINDLTHAQWIEVQESQNHRCYYCGKRCKGHLTQDHITPVIAGGSHTLHNVIAACQSCNSKKGTKPPPIPVQPLLLTVAPSKNLTLRPAAQVPLVPLATPTSL